MVIIIMTIMNMHKEKIMPPNCDNEGYYINIGVCKPDNLCKKIKNPVQYAKIKARNS
jgi:DNA primase large subunit